MKNGTATLPGDIGITHMKILVKINKFQHIVKAIKSINYHTILLI